MGPRITKAMRVAYENAVAAIIEKANKELAALEAQRRDRLAQEAFNELFAEFINEPLPALSDADVQEILKSIGIDDSEGHNYLPDNWAEEPESAHIQIFEAKQVDDNGIEKSFPDEVYQAVDERGIKVQGNTVFVSIVPREEPTEEAFLSKKRAMTIIEALRNMTNDAAVLAGNAIQLVAYSIYEYKVDGETIRASDEGEIWNWGDKKHNEQWKPYLAIKSVTVSKLQRAAYLLYSKVESGNFTLTGWMEITILPAADPKVRIGLQREGLDPARQRHVENQNCLLQALGKAILNGQRALNTEHKRRIDATIAQWQRITPAEGFDISKSLDDLARALKIRITYHDGSGNVVKSTKEIKGKRHIELFGSNNHAFGEELPRFPARGSRTALEYPPNVVSAIESIYKKARENAARIRNKSMQMLKPDEWIPATVGLVRAVIANFASTLKADLYWLCGTALVSASGNVYLMPAITVRDATTLMWAELNGANPDNAPENLRADYFSPAALVFERFRQDNGILACDSACVNQWQAAQFEVLAMPYVARFDVQSDPAGQRRNVGQLSHVDIVQSYLACESDNEFTLAADYIKRYGFPSGELMTHFDMRGVRPEEIWNMNGIVKLASWTITAKHPAIGLLVSTHLYTREWIPISLLEYLIRSGDLTVITLAEGWIANARTNKFKFVAMHGEDCLSKMKEYGRISIGKLAEKSKTTIVCTDEYEARFRIEQAQQRGESVAAQKLTDGVWALECEMDSAKYYHVRSNVLAYSAINLFEGIRCFEPKNIIRVLTDGIIYKDELPQNLNVGQSRGQWRQKPITPWKNHPSPDYELTMRVNGRLINGNLNGIEFNNAVVNSTIVSGSLNDALSGALINSTLSDDPGVNQPNVDVRSDGQIKAPSLREALDNIARIGVNLSDYTGYRLIYSQGQGGSGKTYQAVAAAVAIYGAANVVICVPSHDMRESHTRDYCERYPGLTVSTWQKVVGFGFGCMKTWSPIQTRVSQARRKCVIWDEIFLTGDWEPTIKPLLDALRDCGSVVIAAGDPYQLEAVQRAVDAQGQDAQGRGGASQRVHEGLLASADHVITNTEDRRALCPKLRELKLQIWGASDKDQLIETRKAVPSFGIEHLLDKWHPRDIVLATTIAMKNEIAAALLEVHARKYPNEPSTIVVRVDQKEGQEKAKKIPKQLIVPGTTRLINAHIGSTAMVPIHIALNLPEPWQQGVCRTIHSFQGGTIGGESEADSPKVWIIAQTLLKEFAHNSVYTMVSRARWCSQLALIDMPIKQKIPQRVLEIAQERAAKREATMA